MLTAACGHRQVLMISARDDEYAGEDEETADEGGRVEGRLPEEQPREKGGEERIGDFDERGERGIPGLDGHEDEQTRGRCGNNGDQKPGPTAAGFADFGDRRRPPACDGDHGGDGHRAEDEVDEKKCLRGHAALKQAAADGVIDAPYHGRAESVE